MMNYECMTQLTYDGSRVREGVQTSGVARTKSSFCNRHGVLGTGAGSRQIYMHSAEYGFEEGICTGGHGPGGVYGMRYGTSSICMAWLKFGGLSERHIGALL